MPYRDCLRQQAIDLRLRQGTADRLDSIGIAVINDEGDNRRNGGRAPPAQNMWTLFAVGRWPASPYEPSARANWLRHPSSARRQNFGRDTGTLVVFALRRLRPLLTRRRNAARSFRRSTRLSREMIPPRNRKPSIPRVRCLPSKPFVLCVHAWPSQELKSAASPGRLHALEPPRLNGPRARDCYDGKSNRSRSTWGGRRSASPARPV